jgi:hypothetical protein
LDENFRESIGQYYNDIIEIGDEIILKAGESWNYTGIYRLEQILEESFGI